MSKQTTNIQTLKDAKPTDLEPYPNFARKLDALQGDFRALLGSDAEVARFKRIVLNAIAIKPELLSTEPRSLLAACMRAAQDGLMLDNREAVLNIYNVKVKDPDGRERWERRAQYLPMVAGIIKRLFASGAITYLDAACVYAGDFFEYTRGDTVSLTHKPTMGARGEIVAAYCVMRLKSGELKREVMSRADIERVRNASQSPDKGPWKDWFDQQAIKSVIRRAYKQIDADTSVDRLIDHDNEASGLANVTPRVPDSLPMRPEPPPPPPRDEPGEHTGSTMSQAQLYDEVVRLTAAATDGDSLDLARDLHGSVEDENARKELAKGIAKRAAELQSAP